MTKWLFPEALRYCKTFSPDKVGGASGETVRRAIGWRLTVVSP
jgi:hypothetical protein